MPKPTFPPFLRVADVSGVLRMSRRSVGRLIESGRLDAIQINGVVLVKGASLENLVNHPNTWRLRRAS